MFLDQPEDAAGGLNDLLHSFSEPQTSTFITPSKNKLSIQSKKGKVSPSIGEEWEKLIIIDDLDDDFASPAHPRPAVDKSPRPKPPSPVKPLDEKTSQGLWRGWSPPGRRSRERTSARPAQARHWHLPVNRSRSRCCCVSRAQASRCDLPSTGLGESSLPDLTLAHALLRLATANCADQEHTFAPGIVNT